jgi:biopolymer transport protein ExbD
MIRFGPPRHRRRPNLTPMIDVVFLLLVFFMLASRFGVERALPLALGAGGGGDYTGPPRLVEVLPNGLSLNGAAIAAPALVQALSGLMRSPDDIVVLRARDGADVQALVTVMDSLTAAGLSRLVLVE